jgi:hypothetical protein
VFGVHKAKLSLSRTKYVFFIDISRLFSIDKLISIKFIESHSYLLCGARPPPSSLLIQNVTHFNQPWNIL